jgi:hypothetical protein
MNQKNFVLLNHQNTMFLIGLYLLVCLQNKQRYNVAKREKEERTHTIIPVHS